MANIYQGKKVFIAGGSGMIGRELAALLQQAGASVRVASLDDPSRAPEGSEFIRADLTDYQQCRNACKGMDYVFNLTGVKGSVKTSEERPFTYFERSVELASNILKAARAEKVKRYLFTSSYSVYAPAEVLNEDDVATTFPSDIDVGNGWGKRFGEMQIDLYKRELAHSRTDDDIQICIVRPSSVFGPYDAFSADGMVVPGLIYRAVGGESPLVVWGDGSQVRDFVFSRDVARGMMMMLEKMPDKPVNLGTGTGHTVKELAETIIKYVDPGREIVFDTTKPLGDRKRVMNMERAKAYGFEATTPFDDAIRETVQWYLNNVEKAKKRYNVFDEKLENL